MALSRTKVAVSLLLAISLIALLGAGWLCLELTAEPALEFTQDPNAVEAYHARRKLQLLESALEHNRRGYIRLSEAEVNSFLREAYHTNRVETNGVSILDSAILLREDGFSFITWLERPFFGRTVPFVWRREIALSPPSGPPAFEVNSMHLGNIEIPSRWWPKVRELLGGADALFDSRRAWVQNLPALAISKNDLSNLPEFRLYTYVPQDSESAQD